MLAGLLFATGDATDRPQSLTATLPFGGTTLIEYQARLLVAAGAGQLLIVVSRLTPELLGAVNRISRRGASVDVVRSAAEASEKLHPLSRLVVVANGAVTTETVLASIAGEGSDALLVTSGDEASERYERISADHFWAGLARLQPQRLAEVAQMPKDYDFQSTLLRAAVQAGAQQIPLPPGASGQGHGIERDSRNLATRGGAVLLALIADRAGWFDRWIIGPVARRLLPWLMARTVPSIAVIGIAAALAVIGLGAIDLGWDGTGLAAVVVAEVLAATGAVLARLRDEPRLERTAEIGALVSAGLAVLLTGDVVRAIRGDLAGWLLGIGIVILAALGERAATRRTRRLWWATPVCYPLVLFPFAAIGAPFAGLGVAALYAVVTLAGAIEMLRHQD